MLSVTIGLGLLRGDVPEVLKVIQKPVLDLDLVAAIQYAADRRAGAKLMHNDVSSSFQPD